MDKGIQLNIQLPLEELGRFSHLLDQLQNLMAAAGTGAREPEGSSTFDPQRFQQLMQAEQQSRGEDPTASQVTAAASQAEISGSLPEAAAARSDLSSMPEIPTAEAAISPLQEAPAARSDTSFLAEPPTAQGDMSPMPEISVSQLQSAVTGTEIPTAQPEDMPSAAGKEPQSKESTPEEGESPSPPAEGSSVQELLELSPPRSAGYYPEVQLPEAPGGNWGGIQEELTFSGPAPLTAEAVSLAFQRDDRRYDNGFPLY